jgi:amino acid adenylation domain-containing protein
MSEHFELVEAVLRRVVARAPEKVAVEDSFGALTYAQLWDRASRVASSLAARGVRAGHAVGVHGIGDRDTITAMAGVLLTGAHFVPVDADYPAERVTQMMNLAGASVLLTNAAQPYQGITSWRVDELAGAGTAGSVDPAPADDPHRTAYVMFTSGSTGTPKAVAVPHGALTALCLRDSPVRRQPDDAVLAHTILTFDPSMLEIWSALLVGASVVCAGGKAVSLHETAGLLLDPRVTTAVLTPAVFALMAENYPSALGALRCLIVGGDVMPAKQAALVRARCPGLEVLNCYGPTENCVISTVFSLDDWLDADTPVPIGRPVAGTSAYVLDAELHPVAPGVIGDLWVGGDRLASAYVTDPLLTAERFRDDAFSSIPGARMYRTGDRASVLPSGDLAFHGREDNELKVRGYRVDLAEVEALVAADPGVREVVAVPFGTGHDRRIRAFARPVSDAEDATSIRARVAGRAPRFLVPDEVVLVSSFPLAANGKVDRTALANEVEGRAEDLPDPRGDRERLARMWQRRTGSAPDTAVDFFTAGGSSLDLVCLIEDVGSQFGVTLDFDDVYGLSSFDELWTMVRPA